jgi:hypothetical protein
MIKFIIGLYLLSLIPKIIAKVEELNETKTDQLDN